MSRPAAPSGLSAWNIAVGNFFFRWRNALFPVLILSSVLLSRPAVIGNPSLDRGLMLGGMVVALLGQAVRLATIGYEYIERGGKQGKVYASHLVHGGVYALTRNPMYLGNGLIAIGITMVAGAPLIYLAILPFFLFVYQAIIVAEETYLRRQFGEEYARYCATVNRLLPALHHIPSVLGPLKYEWGQALRKELSTILALLLGLLLLPVWRQLWFEGWDVVRPKAPRLLATVAGLLAVYGLTVYLKKQRKLFY